MCYEDKVLALYNRVAEECCCGIKDDKFIRKCKERLEEKVTDKIIYLEYKNICQKCQTEEVSITVAVIAVLIAMEGIFTDLYSKEPTKVAIIVLICSGLSAFLAGKALFFMKKLSKCKTMELILDEIYKEKFETTKKGECNQ